MCQNSLPSGGGRSLGAKISGGGVVPLPIYWCHSKGNWLRYNFAADIFIKWNSAADFLSCIVEIVQTTTHLGTLSPFWGSKGRRRTLVDGSLESQCRVLVKCNYRQHCAKRNLPVFNLLRGWFRGFSPRRGDILHRLGEIWHGGPLHAKFHPNLCNDKGVGPQKLKFSLRFEQNVKYKRPTWAYLLCDFHTICSVCASFQVR